MKYKLSIEDNSQVHAKISKKYKVNFFHVKIIFREN